MLLHIQCIIKVIPICALQKATSDMLQAEQEVEEEDAEEEEEGDDNFLTSEHECPLVQQKVDKYAACGCCTFYHGSLHVDVFQ